MKRIPASARLSLLLAFGNAAWATAQNGSTHLPAGKGAQSQHPALSYQLQLTPTKMPPGSVSLSIESDSWVALGFDLKSLLSEIYEFDPRRIEFTDSKLADARYDVNLTTSIEMSADDLQKLAVKALESKLGLSFAHESRAMDVYILTAPSGPGAAMQRHIGGDGTEQFDFEARHCAGIASGGGIKASNGTMQEFSRQLEPDLDRLLIDETHIAGGFDFSVGAYASQEALFNLLHDQLGLVVVPAQRNVSLVVVRPAPAAQAGF